MKFRPRYSILTLLVFMTIVALATTCWKLQDLFQTFHAQVHQLEIRDKTKLLAFESPNHSAPPHAQRLPQKRP